MRGKGMSNLQYVICFRITPAYAGKSAAGNHAVFFFRDHPRLCGEKTLLSLIHFISLGSPPPMRGKGESDGGNIGLSWITPAYAGKSDQRTRNSMRSRDHPRLCGEKCSMKYGITSDLGSPPPMRGKEYLWRHDKKNGGITPAYAGKSDKAKVVLKWNKDHPRLCGEKTKKIPKQRYFFHQPASFSFSLQYT